MAAKENDRVEEWEEGLPTPDELTPLNQSLITPELASAFSISQDAAKSPSDVHRASIATVTALRRQPSSPGGVLESIPAFPVEIDRNGSDKNGIAGFGDGGAGIAAAASPGLQQATNSSFQYPGTQGFDPARRGDAIMANLPYSPYERRGETSSGGAGGGGGGGGIATAEDSSNTAKKLRKQPSSDLGGDEEEADSGGGPENSGEEPAARTLKRPRLVWTPQLHKRFVDAVAHLGIKNAVPKTIMQLMNVEGLTRENVASHLQKYRLYLKRMQGLSSEGPSASDHLFASTPVPPGLAAAAAAAQFMPGHRDEVVALPFSPVVPIGGLAPHVGAAFGPRPPYSSFEHHPYGSLARSVPQRMGGGPGEMVMETQGQPGSSPPRRILTLFPTSSH